MKYSQTFNNFFILFFLLFPIQKSFAFTFNNNAAAAFDKDEITIHVNDTDCADTGDSNYDCSANFITPKLLDLTEKD